MQIYKVLKAASLDDYDSNSESRNRIISSSWFINYDKKKTLEENKVSHELFIKEVEESQPVKMAPGLNRLITEALNCGYTFASGTSFSVNNGVFYREMIKYE